MKREDGFRRYSHLHSGRKTRVTTTMLDLLRALNSEVKAGEEVLVPFIVVDMMERGLLKFIDRPKRKAVAVEARS